jgi:two-component system, chemotaxis family, chemotaxis protein CheY
MSILPQVRVMIVDDQVTSRMLLCEALKEFGFVQITIVGDGEQAMKTMAERPHHLVISDYNMPKMDGLQLLKAIRTHEPTRKAGFLMLTARGDRALVQEAARLGANNVLAKPFDMPTLKKAIEAVIGRF